MNTKNGMPGFFEQIVINFVVMIICFTPALLGLGMTVIFAWIGFLLLITGAFLFVVACLERERTPFWRHLVRRL
jgi:hypothetical protein